MTRFQDQGALRRGSLYVERRADREIQDALFAGEFCYVLAPRQIGKSSLRVRTEARLRERGVRCATIDLTRIGTVGVTADAWYFSLAADAALGLVPDHDPAPFWKRHADLSPPYRFLRFLLDEVLRRLEGPVVISIDEIEMVLDLPFSRDDFFAAIRAVYNARADDPIYDRLTFCLFGVAAPGELMRDPLHTPFNVGRAIRLEDFTPAEAEAFLPGLEEAGGDARALLDAVLAWTSGHPYMTQRLCAALARQEPGERAGEAEADRVAAQVQKLFLERGRLEDPNLAYAAVRMQKVAETALRAEMFRLYRRLLYGGAIPVRGNDAAQQELRLAGMVSERAGEGGARGARGEGPARPDPEPRTYRLVIRNRIFARVFDLRWVDENVTDNPLAEAVAQWMRFGREQDFLLVGAALDAALVWAKGRDDVAAEEREFLDACVQAEHRRRVARQAARERRLLAGLAALVGLIVLAGIALMQERTYSRQLELQQEQLEKQRTVLLDHQSVLEDRVQHTRREMDRVKKESQAKAAAAAAREGEATKEAAVLRDRAEQLEQEVAAKGEAARREAAILQQQAKDADARAAQERRTADEAKQLADEAAEALRRTAEAAQVAQKALETERSGRELAEKQLDEERSHRARVEQELDGTQARLRDAQRELVSLGKQSCWPSEARPRPPRGAASP